MAYSLPAARTRLLHIFRAIEQMEREGETPSNSIAAFKEQILDTLQEYSLAYAASGHTCWAGMPSIHARESSQEEVEEADKIDAIGRALNQENYEQASQALRDFFAEPVGV